MEAINTDILSSQHNFFDKHPFPGLDLDHVISVQQFIYILEKNELYRAIKRLIKPGHRVLDAGCGTGEFTTYLSLSKGAEVIGLDFSEKTIRWANSIKEKINNTPQLKFCEADIFELKPDDFGLFDIALAMGLFTSIPNEVVGMQKVFDVLKPGGVVVFGFFDPVGRVYVRFKRWLLHSISSRFDQQEKICKNVLLRHLTDKNEVIWNIDQLTENVLNYHTPKEAVSLLKKCGLTVTDCFPKLKGVGNIIPDELNTDTEYNPPFVQILGQMNWLRSSTDGYYVLVGRKPLKA